YSLIVEDGTRMARKVAKGELPAPDEDTMARRYEIIANTLDDAGFGWYEVSNWAKEGGECRHNMIYWRDQEWRSEERRVGRECRSRSRPARPYENRSHHQDRREQARSMLRSMGTEVSGGMSTKRE